MAEEKEEQIGQMTPGAPSHLRAFAHAFPSAWLACSIAPWWLSGVHMGVQTVWSQLKSFLVLIFSY